ncbi:YHYH protein [Tabrizicola sp.]|uniref:YHYH protein n=1 Tax=Tabrizicola sp. TaxID=2005166 RepID=UPI003F300856
MTRHLIRLIPFLAAVPGVAVAQDEAERLVQIKAMFDPAAIVSGPDLVDCTLSGGTETTCFSITVKSSLAENEMGPWCPRNITDGPEVSGIWPHEGKVQDADGAFVKNLSTFYDDPNWQLFDPATGEVNVTEGKEACELAARPNVDPAYQNHCVECQTSYMEQEAVLTYVIPMQPVDLDRPERPGPFVGIGLAFNGIKYDAPAPVDRILGAYTLAPFDDCGGHVNPHAGYHYHAVTGCSPEIAVIEDHAPTIGIAMDGYPLFAQLDPDGTEPSDLDECRGHVTEGIGYHYHVADAGANQTIGCFKAEYGCSLDDPSQTCDATKRPPPP